MLWQVILLLCATPAGFAQPAESQPDAAALANTSSTQASTQAKSPLAASAIVDGSAETAEIIDLTNELLLKEIDLERYYIKYRIPGNQEPKGRRVRFFLAQQAAGGSFLGSNIVNTFETAKHFNTPEDVSGRVFAGSGRVGLTGSVLGASSSAIELCSNGLLAIKNKIHKEDPTSAKNNVIGRLKVIDALTAKRDAAVAKLANRPAYEIYVAEGKVLKSFRDWCVYEFTDVYSDIKSNQSSNNVFYAMDVGAYSVSFASYILGLKASRKPDLAFDALKCGFVSDALFTAEAPATTFANTHLYKYHWSKLSRELKESPKDAEEDAKKLMINLEGLTACADELTQSQLGPIASRLAIYSYWSTRYDKFIDKRLGDIRRQSKIALQSNVSGPLLGVAGLSQDVFNAVGLYKCRNNPFAQNSLAFAGAATSTCASAASVGLSAWWFADQIKHDREFRRFKLMPEMLLEERLRTLTVLEQMLTGEDKIQ